VGVAEGKDSTIPGDEVIALVVRRDRDARPGLVERLARHGSLELLVAKSEHASVPPDQLMAVPI
jgi:hypothetical protein